MMGWAATHDWGKICAKSPIYNLLISPSVLLPVFGEYQRIDYMFIRLSAALRESARVGVHQFERIAPQVSRQL